MYLYNMFLKSGLAEEWEKWQDHSCRVKVHVSNYMYVILLEDQYQFFLFFL